VIGEVVRNGLKSWRLFNAVRAVSLWLGEDGRMIDAYNNEGNKSSLWEVDQVDKMTVLEMKERVNRKLRGTGDLEKGAARD
jgi:hypothetical protein